jgi:hypothetical protein
MYLNQPIGPYVFLMDSGRLLIYGKKASSDGGLKPNQAAVEIERNLVAKQVGGRISKRLLRGCGTLVFTGPQAGGEEVARRLRAGQAAVIVPREEDVAPLLRGHPVSSRLMAAGL